MHARDLNEVDRRISKTLQHIERHREIVEKLKRDGHEREGSQAQQLLETYDDSLKALLERRRFLLSELYHLHTTSKPAAAASPRRKKSTA